ncbi:N-acetylmuramoyl-L-alanine amidase [Lutispora sp.]|uniref:N-acetylmuramoyl-L-alanine amidase n=1 Tax=Lutispora sp. TaxID=2828727 RepID=UPI003561614D
MAIRVREMLLTNHNRPGKKIIKLKGIVIHWTANTRKGANAVANRNYFNNTKNSVSAHYIVDDKNIIRCIPDDEFAYHVGAKKYAAAGLKIKVGNYSPNYFLIGIEMCVNSDGDWSKTYQNTVELAAYLLKKYNLNINNMYRHHDITGKDCPKMMLDPKEWQAFKDKVSKQMDEIKLVINKELVIIDKIVKNNRIYVPVREVFEFAGAHIGWDQEKKFAYIRI